MASSRHARGRAARAALRRALHSGFAALLLTGAGWSAAHAQGFYREVYGPPRGYVVEDEDLLRPREIVDGLRDRGFSEMSRPRYDGRAYRVEATGPRGLRVRLVVDARDGEVIGREPLGAAYYPSDRPRPAAPGYGWTEEDMQPRRLREAERIVPPADIPSVPALRNAPLGGEREAGRAVRAERVPPPVRPEANPLGLNPDTAARPESGRRAARTAPSPKLPSQARIAPPAPEPTLRQGKSGSEAMTPAAKSEPKTAKAVEPKLETKPEPGKAAPAAEAAKEQPKEPAKTSEPAKTAEAAPPAKKEWQDPPADGSRKNVRVIGGATVVPGGSGEAGAN